MMPINIPLFVTVAVCALFRIAEITLGDINAKKLLEMGGREFSPWQRPPIVIAYAVWLGTLLFLTPPTLHPQTPFLILFFMLQAMRWWAIGHLKHYWTTRIIIVPLAWKVTTGPYRVLKHPIYMVLGLEVFALSLAFDQWATACFFGGLTILWIYLRIRAESRALMMML
jgi:methyltransferase